MLICETFDHANKSKAEIEFVDAKIYCNEIETLEYFSSEILL